MDVLIGFVTTHDPVHPKGGPGNLLTALKALEPDFAYLLYTEQTASNREALKAHMAEDPRLRRTEVPERPPLPLDDVTDYGRLADLLPEQLREIRLRHLGARFHLVSGLSQVRLIFALSLSAGVLDGTLWEVNPPDPRELWPADREGYRRRLEPVDVGIFHRFRELARRLAQRVRLRIDLELETAELDGQRLDLRSKSAQPRTFQLLTLLAARKVYGRGQDSLTKQQLIRWLYSDVYRLNAQVNVPRAVRSINAQARRLSRADAPLAELIATEGRGGRYRLTDALEPAEDAIEFRGDLRQYLQERVQLSPSEIEDLFPDLPGS